MVDNIAYNFELEKLKEIPKYLTKWNIREETYGKIILTEVLDEISEDEHEQYLAHLREKYIFERQGIEEAGFDKGMAKGKAEGLAEGRKQGRKQSLEAVAQKMKAKNMKIDEIAELTGLTKEEIEKL